MRSLVNAFESAAQGYGIEKRVILLHGPVGSSKSTIARLLKKGLERYSRMPQGGLYTYTWRNLHDVLGMEDLMPCQMHEDPLHLVPLERRGEVLAALNQSRER